MNIAMFSDVGWPQRNGVVVVMRDFANELVKQGHNVILFFPKPGKNPEADPNLDSKVKVHYIPSVPFPSYPGYRITTIFSPNSEKVFKEFKPDVVHIHSPFGAGLLGINLAKKHKLPVVGTYHTLLPEYLAYLPIPILKNTKLAKDLTWKVTNHIYNKCNLVTTPSPMMLEELEKNKLKAPARVLSNGINLENFSYKKDLTKPISKIIIYFGRVSFEKGIDKIIDAIEILKDESYDAKLMIIGNGPAYDSLKKQAEKLNLTNEVKLTNFFAHKDLPQYVKDASVFVSASTTETFGLTYIEAMSFGLPCIAAKAAAAKNMIKEDENGIFFKPDDANDLAKQIKILLEDEQKIKTMAKNAIEYSKTFSIESITKDLVKMYSEVKDPEVKP